MARIQVRESQAGEKRYYVTIRLKGFPVLSATFARLTDAKVWIQNTESDLKRGRYLPVATDARHTLLDLIGRYEREVLPLKAPSSQASDRLRLKWWKERLGYMVLKDITPAVLAEARSSLADVGRGNGPASQNRYLALISHCFTKAVEWGWMATAPKLKKHKEPRGRIRYLNEDELVRFLSSCQKSPCSLLYPAVVLTLSTGIRRGEMWNLRWQDIDLDLGRIVLLVTKNKDRRGVPVTGEALQELRDLAKVRRIDSDLVFPSPKAVGAYDLRAVFAAAVRDAGITDFRWHDLRHTCASYMAMQGVPLRTIAEILGHRTLQMVQRYSHLSPEHLREAAENLNRRIFNSAPKGQRMG